MTRHALWSDALPLRYKGVWCGGVRERAVRRWVACMAIWRWLGRRCEWRGGVDGQRLTQRFDGEARREGRQLCEEVALQLAWVRVKAERASMRACVGMRDGLGAAVWRDSVK